MTTINWGGKKNIIAAGALIAAVSCGGGGSTPTQPGGGGSGQPGVSGATITIANGRVTPSSVTIAVGQSVTFLNQDGRVRNVSSDQHPAHTDCPAINAIGNMNNGQSRLTNALTTARTCGFHDHDDPDNALVKGTIVIQ